MFLLLKSRGEAQWCLVKPELKTKKLSTCKDYFFTVLESENSPLFVEWMIG